MAAPKLRTQTPLLIAIRDFLFGRPSNNPLRFEPLCSPRSQPPPTLPDGPSHKLADNYYLTRDGRRECHPPITAYLAGQKVIESGDKSGSTAENPPPIPGFGYDWTTGKATYH